MESRELDISWKSDLVQEPGDEAAIDAAKLRCRGDLTLLQWTRQGYAWDSRVMVEPTPLGSIARRSASALRVPEFVREFDVAALPCIISGCAADWPAWRGAWDPRALLKNYGSRRFKCGEDDDGVPVRLELRQFLLYMAQSRDDSPAYIFDSMYSNGRRCGILDEYSVPPYFCDDLFSLVGEHRRPPYRWFLVGPQRSGTRLHIDPLGTSAWCVAYGIFLLGSFFRSLSLERLTP
jgi:hypothetical protein